MKEALFGMGGIFVGALITYISNYLLEKSKNKMAMQKHLFELKRARLEEFYILIENSIKFSTDNLAQMYTILYDGKKSVDKNKYKRTAYDFYKLTNIINMYFDDDKVLKDLIIKVNIAFKNGQRINEAVFFDDNKYNKDELKIMLIDKWKLFADILDDIKKEIPRVFKSLN